MGRTGHKTYIYIISVFICCVFLCVKNLPVHAEDLVADSEDDYTYIENDEDVYITGLISQEYTKLIIPSEVHGKPVVKISGFSGYSNITEVVVPDSVTSIGVGTFKNTKIVSITLPFIGWENRDFSEKLWNMFGYIFGYETSKKSGTVEQSVYYSTGSKKYYFYIPTTLKNVTITNDDKIIPYSFSNCTFIENISLNEGIRNIESNAFANCTGLKNINIPSSVTEIGSSAFYKCSSLESISIPEGITSIKSNTFYGCNSLINISVPSSVNSIESGAFYECSNLHNINLSDGIKNIGWQSFYNCSNLSNIMFSNKLETISSEAFYGCKKITTLNIPDSVISIGEGAFRGTKLVDISLPFIGYSREESELERGVFGFIFGYESNDKSEARLPSGTTVQCIKPLPKEYYGNSYWGYYIPKTIKNVRITDATSIPTNAFYNCSFINNIFIGEGCTEIKRGAFYKCTGLISLQLPDSLISLDENLFSTCTNLTIHANKNTEGYKYAKSNEIPVISTKSVSFINKTETLYRNDKRNIEVVAYMLNGQIDDSPDFIYESTNTDVVTISNGKFIASGPGIATITATCEGYSDTCEVTVYYLLESISLEGNKTTIDINNSQKLSVACEPTNTTDVKTINWTSSNDNIVRVSSDGTIIGVSKGTVTITAESVMGPTDTISIEVLVPAANINIHEEDIRIEKGATKKLSLDYLPNNTTDSFTWYSTNPNIVKVDDDGNIEAVSPGSAQINVYTNRGLNDVCNIEVVISSIKVELDKTELKCFIDDNIVLEPTMTPLDTTDTIDWSSSNNGVVYVDSYGNVQLISAGYARVTATATSGKSAFCDITVENDIKAASIILKKEKISYTGEPIIPEYDIKYNGVSLKNNGYYEECYNNTSTGIATIKVIGTGRYSGEKEASFEIIENRISKENVDIDLSNEPYTGEAITKDIEITFNGKRLNNNSDYTVSYQNNTEPGQAQMSILGKGIYVGSVELTFNISENIIKEDDIIVDLANEHYTGKEIIKSIDIIYNGSKLIENTDYIVSYESNVNSGKATITVKGIGIYSGKNQFNFYIVDNEISSEEIDIDLKDELYDGSEKKKDITVFYNEKLLTSDIDYILKYSNNVNIGKATVTIEGIGQYSGKHIFSYNIIKDEFEDVKKVIKNAGVGSNNTIEMQKNNKTYQIFVDDKANSLIFNVTSKDVSGNTKIDYIYSLSDKKVDIIYNQNNSYKYGASEIVDNISNLDNLSYNLIDGNASSSALSTAKVSISTEFNKLAELLFQKTNKTIYEIGFKSYNHTHYGGTADCNNKAKCSLCGCDYGNVVSHKIVTKNAKDANYEENGYTGDKVCELCGKVLEKGKTVNKLTRVAATGKYKLLKDYIQKQKNMVNGTEDKCIFSTNTITSKSLHKVNVTSSISYSSKDAKFYFINIWKFDTGESYLIKASIDENGSNIMNIVCSNDSGAIQATGSLNVALYTVNYHINFKMDSFVESKYTTKNDFEEIWNDMFWDGFVRWELLLIENFSSDINMGNLGFTSFEEPFDHTWDNGKITRQPVGNKNGVKTYTCKVCGVTKTEEIPATEKGDSSEISGVGKISDDGTKIIDSDGKKYFISSKLNSNKLVNNMLIADKNSCGKYKITKITKKNGKVVGGTVTYMKPYNKKCKTATAKTSVKLGGVSFKVTSIANNAFKNCTSLTKITIGKNITQIGSNSFKGCSKLKNVVIKTSSIKKIGSNSFKGLPNKAVFKVPSKKYDKYSKMIKKAGAPKAAKITK